ILYLKEVKAHHLLSDVVFTRCITYSCFISVHPESWNPMWSVSRYGDEHERKNDLH
ncbi:hypothetical protein B296_00035654, partial [Ensete ventricosum]